MVGPFVLRLVLHLSFSRGNSEVKMRHIVFGVRYPTLAYICITTSSTCAQGAYRAIYASVLRFAYPTDRLNTEYRVLCRALKTARSRR